MLDSLYERLREHLDGMPVSFPKTESGLEIAILKKIFDPEEAEMALHLASGTSETAESFAKKTDLESKKAAEWLERMADKGQIIKMKKGERVFYNAVQFVPGIWEHQLNKLTPEFAELNESFFKASMGKILNNCEVPLMRILPVDENIPVSMEVMPYQKVKDLIRSQNTMALADCICRKERRLGGHTCSHIDDVCILFSHMANFYVEKGLARFVTSEEAIHALDRAEKDGLVHSPLNAQRPMALCNCCSCCCVILRGITEFHLPRAKVFRTDFSCVCDSEACVGCGKCTERCHVGAVELVGDIARVEKEKCIGCGLCVSTCPTEALSLVQVQQPGLSEPPFSTGDLYKILSKGKSTIHTAG